MFSRRRLTPIAALALLAGLAGCGSDTAGPGDVDPSDVSTSVSSVASDLASNAAFQSLGALGGQTFAAVSALRAAAPAPLSGSVGLDRVDFQRTIEARRAAMRLFASVRGPSGA